MIVKDSDGSVRVERRNSSSTGDIRIALQRRVSNSSLPSIIPLAAVPETPIVLSAEDALEKSGGKGAAGAFSEHMYPLETLAEKFETHINFSDPNKSRGLTSVQAAEFLQTYGYR